MTLNLDNNTILCDHTLKAFIAALTAASDYERSVKVICEEGYCSFQIMTIDDEAAEEAK
jgi:predicted ArsR family transcriptional regulator